MSVGYQNDIHVHDRFDSRPQRIDIDRRQNHTDCRPAAVSGNQDRNLFMRQTSFGGLASPAARLARKVSFALLALQNMLDIAAGGPGEFSRRPFLKAHISPMISPMRYGEDAVDVVYECVNPDYS